MNERATRTHWWVNANDLWIAATALAFETPVVTRTERHFTRVPHLHVIGYSPAATALNARSAASRSVTRSASPCTVETKPASNGDGAR